MSRVLHLKQPIINLIILIELTVTIQASLRVIKNAT